MKTFPVILMSILGFLSACSSADKESAAASTSNVSAEKKPENTTSQSVSPLKPLGIADAPKEVKYIGEPTAVYQFTDKVGEHLIVVSETGEMVSGPKGGDRSFDMEIGVYHLLKKEGHYTEIWKAQDFVRNCMYDLVLGISPNSVEISDIDKDGEGEISFAYQLNCVSDVSPNEMKLLMYEGSTKYALRGTTKVMDIPSKYTVDASFNSAPAGFLDFAKKKWGLFEGQRPG